MIKINLLPKEIQEKGKGLEWLILFGVLIVIFIAGGLSSYLIQLHGYNKRLAVKTKWAAQLAEIKAKVAQVEQLDSQIRVLNGRKQTVVSLLHGRLITPRFMEIFYDFVPKDVWLTDLNIEERGGGGLKITAVSNSLTIDAIADWMQALESKPDRFSGVDLSSIDSAQSAPGQPATYSFTMTFNYASPPPGA